MSIKKNNQHRRLKTQPNERKKSLTQSNVSFIKGINPLKVKLQTISNQLSQLGSILDNIHTSTPYQSMTDQQIRQQTSKLIQYIKIFNETINDLIIRRRRHRNNSIQQVPIQILQNKQVKNTISYNQRTINSLKEQAKILQNKLLMYSSPQIIFELDKRIEQDLQKTKQLKMNVNQLKKKSVLAGQKLITGGQNNPRVYNDIKQEYLSYLKKKDTLVNKVKKVEQQNQNIIYELAQIDQQYYSIKNVVKDYLLEQENVQQDKHYDLIYKTLKRKLQLSLKKSQRQEELQKRRYYHHLKSLQKLIQEIQKKENQKDKIQQQIKTSQYQIQKLKYALTKSLKIKQYSYRSINQQTSQFLITQTQQYQSKKLTINQQGSIYSQNKELKKQNSIYGNQNLSQKNQRIWTQEKHINLQKQYNRKISPYQSVINQLYSQDFEV